MNQAKNKNGSQTRLDLGLDRGGWDQQGQTWDKSEKEAEQDKLLQNSFFQTQMQTQALQE